MEKMTGALCVVKKRELFFMESVETIVIIMLLFFLVSDFVWNKLNQLHLSQI